MVNDWNAALLIRVWLEQADVFRARLTAVGGLPGDSSVDDVTVVVASSPSDVVHALSAWLEEFLHEAVNPIDSGE